MLIISHPEVAFCGIKDFHRHSDSRVFLATKSRDCFGGMHDVGALDSWQFHDNRLSGVKSTYDRYESDDKMTFLTGFSPT